MRRSPWISFFDSGGCNGCTLEFAACTTPHYDIERFGCLVKPSARHADILVVSGPVTSQCKDRLLRVYEQMNEPKVVVAVGSCAISGGLFRESVTVEGKLSDLILVDAFIPGCPPRPESIINGILKVLEEKG